MAPSSRVLPKEGFGHGRDDPAFQRLREPARRGLHRLRIVQAHIDQDGCRDAHRGVPGLSFTLMERVAAFLALADEPATPAARMAIAGDAGPARGLGGRIAGPGAPQSQGCSSQYRVMHQ